MAASASWSALLAARTDLRRTERKLCRTYGAPSSILRHFPAFPRWANLCRAYGASVFGYGERGTESYATRTQEEHERAKIQHRENRSTKRKRERSFASLRIPAATGRAGLGPAPTNSKATEPAGTPFDSVAGRLSGQADVTKIGPPGGMSTELDGL
jgi:hypothetical protein